jgi:hypothetical protein
MVIVLQDYLASESGSLHCTLCQEILTLNDYSKAFSFFPAEQPAYRKKDDNRKSSVSRIK